MTKEETGEMTKEETGEMTKEETGEMTIKGGRDDKGEMEASD